MKNRLVQLTVALAVVLMSACGSSKSEETPSILKNLAGEWHLTTWVSATPTEFDTYLLFDVSRTFEIYQQIETVGYQKFTGSFTLKGNVLSGIYTSGVTWGSNYTATLSSDNNTLTLVSDGSNVETAVYSRTAIPASIKGSATVAKASRATQLPM